MYLIVVVIEVSLIYRVYNRTCVALRSTLNVVAVSVTAISSRSPDTDTDFFPLLPQLVNSPGSKNPIVNWGPRAVDGDLLFQQRVLFTCPSPLSAKGVIRSFGVMINGNYWSEGYRGGCASM